MKIAANHWGWSVAGVLRWIRWGWAWPVAIWGVEDSTLTTLGGPRVFHRRVKAGPFCFGFGRYTR